ncbi:MAG: ABC transporter permease subunit [Candidatus Limiplasma sp.]|nr:ABC transporter permease subunit [Candidatus Limiplasma sp.]
MHVRPSRGKRRYTFFTDIRKNFLSYLMMLPAAAYTLVFGYLTIPYMFSAFQKFNYRKGLLGSEFVGLANFDFFFKSNAAPRIVGNTVKLNLFFIIGTLIVSVLIAVLLNELRWQRMKKTLQSTLLFPYFLSWIVINYVVFVLISTKYGVLNTLREGLGMAAINFYADGSAWPGILVLAKVWKDMGMNVVIYLAVITGFDPQIYEAAMIDGAGRFRACLSITLRLMLPTISMLTIMSLGKIFYGDFGMIYALVGDNGILQKTTDVIDTYVFRTLRTTGNPSQAMAVGLFQSALGFLTVYFANWVARKRFSDGALF